MAVTQNDVEAYAAEAQKRREEAKKIQHEQVAVYVKEKFAGANEVIEHKYLTDKKIKNYGLKTINGNLLIGVHSIIRNNDNGILVSSIQLYFLLDCQSPMMMADNYTPEGD